MVVVVVMVVVVMVVVVRVGGKFLVGSDTKTKDSLYICGTSCMDLRVR